MKCFKLERDEKVFLEARIFEGRAKRPVIVICPGGGYEWHSPRETNPVALKFEEMGYQTVVVYYSLKEENGAPLQEKPLEDLSWAVAMVRKNREEWNIEQDRVFVCGFSAGGHGAASLGVFWNDDNLCARLGIEKGSNKPNGLILCYPVISAGAFAHKGSFDNLCGSEATQLERDKQSLELHITCDMPPVFIWHTCNDEIVPVQNTIMFTNALLKQGICVEQHLYPWGPHGLSLATKATEEPERKRFADPHVATWVPLCHQWMEQLEQRGVI